MKTVYFSFTGQGNFTKSKNTEASAYFYGLRKVTNLAKIIARISDINR